MNEHQQKCVSELYSFDAKKYYPVLLLASYCTNNDDCTDRLPCDDCLKMSNIALVKMESVERVISGFDYVRNSLKEGHGTQQDQAGTDAEASSNRPTVSASCRVEEGCPQADASPNTSQVKICPNCRCGQVVSNGVKGWCLDCGESWDV